MSPEPTVAESMIRRLSPHLGPHTAKVAMKTFSEKALNVPPEAVSPSDVPVLLEAMHPMLKVMLGQARADAIIADIRQEWP